MSYGALNLNLQDRGYAGILEANFSENSTHALR